MNYKKIALGALAYFISSFVIQGLLGFAECVNDLRHEN